MMEQAAERLQGRAVLASSSERQRGVNACAQPTNQSSLLLHGQMLCEGDLLAILIMGTWVVGEVRQDRSGWYLFATTRVGIRLTAGLTAWWEDHDQP